MLTVWGAEVTLNETGNGCGLQGRLLIAKAGAPKLAKADSVVVISESNESLSPPLSFS
jgi:hypothetical protein